LAYCLGQELSRHDSIYSIHTVVFLSVDYIPVIQVREGDSKTRNRVGLVTTELREFSVVRSDVILDKSRVGFKVSTAPACPHTFRATVVGDLHVSVVPASTTPTTESLPLEDEALCPHELAEHQPEPTLYLYTPKLYPTTLLTFPRERFGLEKGIVLVVENCFYDVVVLVVLGEFTMRGVRED
jgi:hypothetical protein